MSTSAPGALESCAGFQFGATTRRALRSLPVEVLCAIWCFLAALPTLGREDVDDGFFLEVANLWAHGKLPYVAAFDVKAPGAFAILAVAVSLFGPTIAVLKLVSAAAATLASASLYRIVSRYDRAAAIACAVAYPILMQIFGDPVYQIMNAALLVGYRGLLHKGNSRVALAAAGLSLGFACVVKQTCVIDVLFCAALLIVEGARKNRAQKVLALIAGVAVAPAMCLLYFAPAGALAPLLHDTIEIAWRRPPQDPFSGAKIVAFEHDVLIVGLFLPIFLLALRKVRAPTAFPLAPIAAWLLVEQSSDLLQGAIWWTYLTPSLAPALILGSIAAGAYGRSVGIGSLKTQSAFTLGAVLLPLSTHGLAIFARMPRVDHEMLAEVAATIEAARPGSADRLLVLNGSAFPNIVTRLDPPTPYIHYTYAMCDFPGAGLSAVRANFSAEARFIVYEHATSRLSCQTAETTAVIAEGLRDYRTVRVGRTASGEYAVYERIPARPNPPKEALRRS